MDEILERKLVEQTYHVLIAQLDERGIIIDALSPEQIKELSLHDLVLINKRYQVLLRNPIPRG